MRPTYLHAMFLFLFNTSFFTAFFYCAVRQTTMICFAGYTPGLCRRIRKGKKKREKRSASSTNAVLCVASKRKAPELANVGESRRCRRSCTRISQSRPTAENLESANSNRRVRGKSDQPECNNGKRPLRRCELHLS